METLFTPLNCSELEFFPLCLPSFCFTSSSLIPVALEQPGPAGAGRICPVLGCRSGAVGDTHGCRLSAVTEPRGAGQCLQKPSMGQIQPTQHRHGCVSSEQGDKKPNIFHSHFSFLRFVTDTSPWALGL